MLNYFHLVILRCKY